MNDTPSCARSFEVRSDLSINNADVIQPSKYLVEQGTNPRNFSHVGFVLTAKEGESKHIRYSCGAIKLFWTVDFANENLRFLG